MTWYQYGPKGQGTVTDIEDGNTTPRFELVPLCNAEMTDGKGGTLSLLMWKGEPAVLVDGKYLLRRSTLVRELAPATLRADYQRQAKERGNG